VSEMLNLPVKERLIENRLLTHSHVNLKADDLTTMADLIAYRVSDACRYTKTMAPKVGGVELFGIWSNHPEVDLEKIDLSDAFIYISKDKAPDISVQDKGRILHFMLWAGLANIEYRKTENTQQLLDVSDILGILKNCTDEKQLVDLFGEVSICLATPLFYTRLGEDILNKLNIDIEELCSGGLLGKMLELYVRGALTLRTTKNIMTSTKLDYPETGEVDIYDSRAGLLCETTKSDDEAAIKEKVSRIKGYFKETALIRVCSTGGSEGFDGTCHLIPYPKLCCMIDTGDIWSLPRTKGV